MNDLSKTKFNHDQAEKWSLFAAAVLSGLGHPAGYDAEAATEVAAEIADKMLAKLEERR